MSAKSGPKSAALFLGAKLPLTVITTTPVALSTQDDDGAVFSRPVIALGSDFGGADATKKVPFRLTCGVAGKLRWVTTSIARFDPEEDWPPDLECSLKWVASLTAWDGARLQLEGVPARRVLRTSSLGMWLGDITSERAANLTDGAWSYSEGSSADKTPEVPPDAKIELRFSSTVHLRQIQAALQVGRGVSLAGPKQPWVRGLGPARCLEQQRRNVRGRKQP
ncbi:hypothetical protein TSOC_009336 [Tetrabaena socialis]|uniref:Uncharacterized protein n=1 Tax=Tetrabaena socialis TaxID=47790 RepID=A0A2J7ZW65_9CHLO|nr:hypothetical protein TSOC_009336 [Tetrabaena socialis]|eukprot:PNH04504.1 hypothetical protein TSOC_009336 [Tetrabaena socialis]